jgi:hypothetical protein
MTRFRRFRERLVLGPILRYLDGDEEVLAWTHASVPEHRAPAVLLVTNLKCHLHLANQSVPDISMPLGELTAFRLDRRDPEVVRVHLDGPEGDVMVELLLTNRLRSRSVGRVLATLHRQQIQAPVGFDPSLTSPVPPMVRSVKHHARRVWVTVLGVFMLLLGAIFATPVVPGPGALTAVAGIAILAREYEWARDLHVWASRLADRFLQWIARRWRQRSD